MTENTVILFKYKKKNMQIFGTLLICYQIWIFLFLAYKHQHERERERLRKNTFYLSFCGSGLQKWVSCVVLIWGLFWGCHWDIVWHWATYFSWWLTPVVLVDDWRSRFFQTWDSPWLLEQPQDIVADFPRSEKSNIERCKLQCFYDIASDHTTIFQ